MALDGQEVVRRPFYDVIETGKEVISQAEEVSTQDDEISWMILKSGESIVREGERALKRLRPLLEDWPASFDNSVRTMMLQQDDVVRKQRALDELLYDLEDYLGIDSFEEEKFAELRVATKTLALAVMEGLRKLLAAPTKDPTTVSTFPPLPPLPLTPISIGSRFSRQSSVRSSGSRPERQPPLWSSVHRQHHPAARDLEDSGVGSGGHSHAPNTMKHEQQAALVSSPVLQTRRHALPPTTIGTARELRSVASYPTELSIRERSFEDIHGAHPSVPGVVSERENVVKHVESRISASSTTDGSAMTDEHPSWKPLRSSLEGETSFDIHKGFCGGALLYREEGPERGTVKIGGAGEAQAVSEFASEMYAGTTRVILQEGIAKCRQCVYSHKYPELLKDVDGDDTATVEEYGVQYRLRFLYKCHISMCSVPVARYACPFCIHVNSTWRNGDATVFPSVAHLLRHLSRHPQPLPDVPGFRVLHNHANGRSMMAVSNDFDLRFPSPPATPGGPPEMSAARLGVLPAAIAVADRIQMQGGKSLKCPEKATVAPLQFFRGACILGVEFPEQWGGNWCTGWHDGEFGAFPFSLVRLEAPRKRMAVSLGLSTGRRVAVARWKWDVKGGIGAGWVGFNKGEKLSDLEWDNSYDWCWIGTNKKGKTGIFPSSHIKMESIKLVTA